MFNISNISNLHVDRALDKIRLVTGLTGTKKCFLDVTG